MSDEAQVDWPMDGPTSHHAMATINDFMVLNEEKFRTLAVDEQLWHVAVRLVGSI
jgi:hypothetical protein